MTMEPVTYEKIAQAATNILEKKEKLTIQNIRNELGNTGSLTTISKYLKIWRNNNEENAKDNFEHKLSDPVSNAVLQVKKQLASEALLSINNIKEEYEDKFQKYNHNIAKIRTILETALKTQLKALKTSHALYLKSTIFFNNMQSLNKKEKTTKDNAFITSCILIALNHSMHYLKTKENVVLETTIKKQHKNQIDMAKMFQDLLTKSQSDYHDMWIANKAELKNTIIKLENEAKNKAEKNQALSLENNGLKKDLEYKEKMLQIEKNKADNLVKKIDIIKKNYENKLINYKNKLINYENISFNQYYPYINLKK